MGRYNSPPNPPLTFDTLSEAMENSRIVAEATTDAIITINDQSTILFVNSAAATIFGYSTEELLGSELTLLMPEYLRPLHRAALERHLVTGEKHISWEAIDFPGLHKDGHEISLKLSLGEFQKDGQRLFTGIARDVSKCKDDERHLTLQHSVAQMLSEAPTLADAAPKLLAAICENLEWQFAALWSVTPGGNDLGLVTHWRQPSSHGVEEFEFATLNANYKTQLGFPGKILESKSPVWITDFSEEDFQRSTVAARSTLHSAFGFPITVGEEVLGVIELFCAGFQAPDARMLSSLVTIGNKIGEFVERKRNEAELVDALARAHEARLETERLAVRVAALQRISDAALARMTLDHVLSESLLRIREVLNVDTVAVLLLEAEGDEVVAWAAQGLEEEVEQGVRIPVGKGFAGKVVAEQRPIIISNIYEADVINPLLEQKGIKSLLGVPLLVEGRPTGVLHVGRMHFSQFTEDEVQLLELAAARIALAVESVRLYQVERSARAEAEAANKAKDEFLTILSHELRTPLTPIIGWVHMMQNGILKPAEFDRVFSVISRNAYNLKRLINDLLDMSAILSGKMRIEETPVSVARVLEESVETMRTYASDARVTLEIDIQKEPTTLMVNGDHSRLDQTFCNLLHNAIKFSRPNDSIEVSCQSIDSNVVVRISDHGHGIPAEFIPFVFERFRQADASRTRMYGGLGLGLSLVKSFVEAHRGTIEVFSPGEGLGSTFVVTLPRLAITDQALKAGTSEAAVNDGRVKHILLVEDQVDTLEMLELTLRKLGYEVSGYSSAAAALEARSQEHFDLIISDVGMPEMDGLQFLNTFRSDDKHKLTPAIALTGYASKTDIEAVTAAGFDLHLSKPVDPQELGEAIEKILSPQRMVIKGDPAE